METQAIINAGLAAAGFLCGWVLNRIMRTLDRIDEDVRKIPEKYISKDDYHRDISDIKTMLKSIFDKLDDKADK